MQLRLHRLLDQGPQHPGFELVHDVHNAALKLGLLGVGVELHVALTEPLVVLLHAVPDAAIVLDGEQRLGGLTPGVVDVVLYLDGVPRRPQNPGHGVAQHHVAQVPDMQLLVGVDRGVLDDDFAFLPGQLEGTLDHAAHEGARIEEKVQERPGGLHLADAGGQHHRLRELRGDLGGVAARRLGHLKGGGGAVVARLVGGRFLNGGVDRRAYFLGSLFHGLFELGLQIHWVSV